MARITKYMLGALVLAVVIIAAILMAGTAGLLGGALVVLLALIGVLLAVRFQVNRNERSAQADWTEVLDDQPADGSGFTGWVPNPTRGDRVPPPHHDELPPPPDPRPGPVVAGHRNEPPAADHPATEGPSELEWVFPLDESATDTSTFPDTDDFPEADSFPSSDPFTPLDPYSDSGRGTATGYSGTNGHGPHAPAFEPIPTPRGSDTDTADALAYVGAAAAGNGQRRSVIDWSGPVRTVESQVHTNEDILEASAATALPTGGDRPAPAPGSELARLLAKVEARLRDYE